MTDYIQKLGNFNANYIDSVFGVEGWHDLYNIGKAGLTSSTSTASKRITDTLVKTGKRTIEFAFIPNSGFLSRISREPVIRNVLSRLSTDRYSAPSIETCIICWKCYIGLISFNLTNDLSEINPVKIIKPSPCSQSNLPDPRHNNPRHRYNTTNWVQCYE